MRQGFHGFDKENNHFASAVSMLSQPIFGGGKTFEIYEVSFKENVSTNKKDTTKETRNQKLLQFFVRSRHFACEIRGRNSMASRLVGREIAGSIWQQYLTDSRWEKNPKLPIRITQSDEQQQRRKIIFSRRDGEKEYLSSNFVDKLGKNQPWRIPIKTEQKDKSGEEKQFTGRGILQMTKIF